GDTWLFCSGKEQAVHAALRGPVAGWMHHTPGTAVERLLIAAPATMLIDSSRAEGRRRLGDIDTFTMIHPLYCCTCTFVPGKHRNELVVAYGQSRLVIDRNGLTAIVEAPGRARRQRMGVPAQAIMKNGRFTLRPFD
ncbi:MAG: hypothetical protein JXA18_11025, partial [Chitinispirillaceae bacterium]|nr:hypothetical protein [Chitinispirillaceae bacterium]